METNERLLTELRDMYRGKDWFHDVGFDQYGRPVVYVKYECHETNHDIPDRIGTKQVLVHFAASVQGNKDSFVSKPKTMLGVVSQLQTDLLLASLDKTTKLMLNDVNMKLGMDTEEQERELEQSVQKLTDELAKLKQLCEPNILEAIFYEIKDGKNAVTNLSAKFPKARQNLENLYEQYGFDLLYEELND